MMSRRTVLCNAALAGGISFAPGQLRAGQFEGDAGFWYPEETDPHERTFMQWPVNPAIHPDADFLYDLQGSIADIANSIVDFEPVVMLAAARHHRAIRARVSGKVEL